MFPSLRYLVRRITSSCKTNGSEAHPSRCERERNETCASSRKNAWKRFRWMVRSSVGDGVPRPTVYLSGGRVNAWHSSRNQCMRTSQDPRTLASRDFISRGKKPFASSETRFLALPSESFRRLGGDLCVWLVSRNMSLESFF